MKTIKELEKEIEEIESPARKKLKEIYLKVAKNISEETEGKSKEEWVNEQVEDCLHIELKNKQEELLELKSKLEQTKEICKIIEERKWIVTSYGRSTAWIEEVKVDDSIEKLLNKIKGK